jgi:beta-glucosidase
VNHVVVVLETGGAVFMPWLNQVGGVLQAWYRARAALKPAPVLTGSKSIRSPALPFRNRFSNCAAGAGRPEVNARIEVITYRRRGGGHKWFDLHKLKALASVMACLTANTPRGGP